MDNELGWKIVEKSDANGIMYARKPVKDKTFDGFKQRLCKLFEQIITSSKKYLKNLVNDPGDLSNKNRVTQSWLDIEILRWMHPKFVTFFNILWSIENSEVPVWATWA